MEISYWHLFILLPVYLGVLATSADLKISSENVSDVEFTTKKMANNIMKLNREIGLPAINTSFSKTSEIGNNSLPLHHWRKHMHHSKRHRKSLESSRKHHIASLSSQKSNLSLMLPMNWKRNRLSISPPSTNDSQQVFTNLIHQIINLNNNLSVLSAHSPIDSEANNAQNLHYDANNTVNFIANHMTNNSGFITPKLFNESHTVCNMTENLNNQSCNNKLNLLNSVNKTSETLKKNSTTSSSFLDRLRIQTKPSKKSKAFELNQQHIDDSFLRILEKKPLFPISEKGYATIKSNFIIFDDLGYFVDPTEETPIIKSREVFHPRLPLIDYIFGEKFDNPASEIENRMKYIDLWNLETNKTRTVEPRVFKIKIKLSEDNDHILPPWSSDNIYLPKISEPKYSSQMNNKKVEVKVQDRSFPLRSVKQPKSKVLNESDFQSAFLSTFYISIAICGIFFAIAVWWRRFSVMKKSNFTTISDSVHLSPTPSSPLAARRPGQSRV